MMSTTDSFWDILIWDEADFIQAVMLRLANEPWTQSIVPVISDNGVLTCEKNDQLFELRFAYALHRAGITSHYEISGRVISTIDFGFALQRGRCAVELLRLGETQRQKRSGRDITPY